MKSSLKLRTLESKISELESQKQDLLKQRLADVAALISRLDLAHIDDKVLVGGLIFLREKITAGDKNMEDWHLAGERFLRTQKTKRKNNSKKVKSHHPTPQSSQSITQQGDE